MNQNDLHDRVTELYGKDFTPTHVRDNPLTFESRAVQRQKSQLGGSKPSPPTNKSEATEQKGNIMTRDLRQKGEEC